ncbi:MAG TPA: isoprenylcysteine carboxylmethyltransferase family protein [Anaerolineaceae bacterium]|nr:isoprenylcysteine carboxylmethyltransferase family protein [Anaerolineaceae bacterium]
MSAVKVNPTPKLDRDGINRIIQVLGFLLVTGGILFACAGRLAWIEAWVFLSIYLAGVLLNGLWTLRHDPGLINERGRIGPNAKSWDKIIGLIYTVLLLGTMIVSGLDARFGWSTAPLWVKIIGGIGVALSLGMTFWVMTANTFLSSIVRIQDDRGHQTVTQGPYQFVRHPMYAGLLFMFWSIPLLLGSWSALIPSALNTILFVVRTALEDRTLQAELPGYKEYVQQVRCRLIPGIW